MSGPSSRVVLVADGLSKSYRGAEAVRDVHLRLDAGRIVGLVGANGAGKTTTLKMLAGLLAPSAGTATIDGRPTLETAVRQRIGYLPEDSPLYDELPTLPYLAFFGELYGLSHAEARRRSESLLERLDCDRIHWKKPTGTLSKGLRRKVAIARCLLHDPEVLLLDEPTSGLDPSTTQELNEFLRELRSRGKAILLSAHNLPQVEELCDEILVMSQGRIVTRGTLQELRGRIGTQRYRLRATVAFPGSQPHGTVHEAWISALPAVEDAMEAVRSARGVVLEVESIPPKLEEILRRVTEE